MALGINITTDSGVVSTYGRVKTVKNKALQNGNEVDNVFLPKTTTIDFEYWLDEATRNLAKDGGGQIPLQVKTIETDGVLENMEEVYIHLKSLPEFSEATDN